jgi:ATP-dependent RNA helicase HelY
VRAGFLATLGFPLDPFQTKALDALDEGRSVLVAAPTGSGKTVVAEYAVAKALAEGGKAFYTTPLKALSNQKYGDLVRRHGPDRVGLLTGDNSINGDSPVVVMTTEVLRNMIYAGSPVLADLRCVVLDEVHYLQNPYRGAVWEEVIIHSPPPVKLVCLSATVSNAEEFADWISTVRGDTAAIIEERRPVALNQLYVVGDRRSERLHLLPTFVDGRPNPAAAELDAGPVIERPRGRARSRLYTPWRSEVVDRLEEESMLPAIYFIFSRAACDDAVRQCLDDGIRLTTPEERGQIRSIVEAKVEALSDDDLRVLGYGTWLTGLEAGLGAHHAGLVPPFKEAVEACFAAALVKVVFATETLSLGINMPARSVVIEKLTKFTGERHETLTAGEYTQLTGRAGRRGIDEVGYAIVLWSRFVSFSQVAGLASTRSYALTSSFRPTYNMTANLVRRYPPDQAHHLLNLSFAQYRADADVVHLEAQLERTTSALTDARHAASCDRGDVEEYRRLQEALRRASGGAGDEATHRAVGHPAEIQAALERIRPGDVLMLPGAIAGDRVVVITTARRRGGDVRLGTVSVDTRKVMLRATDFATPPHPVARIELPVPYDPSTARFVREAAAALRRLDLDDATLAEDSGVSLRRRHRSADKGARRSRAGAEGTAHPVAACPQLRKHLRAAERADRLERERERLERRVRGRSESLARQFDRVLELLRRRGYVEGWSLTEPGERLARIYHEADLLVAETLEAGLLDGLDPASVAALVSVFTFEPRGSGSAPPNRFGRPSPSPEADRRRRPAREAGARTRPGRDDGRKDELERRWRAVEQLARRLGADETAAGLPPTRALAGLPPTRALDPGFSPVAYAWAAGGDLGRVLADEEVSGGDFVRNVKQLIDLLRQIEQVAPLPSTARAAGRAADELFRDIVAASSVLDAASAAAS